MNVRLIVEPDKDAAARWVANRLAEAARAGGHVVLTGGSTPKQAYELAAGLEPDWSKVDVWWGDERCVAPDDERSNYGMAKAALLDRLRQQPKEVHRIRGELEPEAAASVYDREIRGVVFDVILNGIGPDGHTASLFPNAPTLDERERLVVAAAPGHEPFVERVTMTIPALESCRELIFLAVGEEKADAVRRAFGEPPSPATPSSLVRSALGETIAVLDPAAAADLPGQ